MPLYDSSNPIPSLHAIVGLNNILWEKYLKHVTTNTDLDQFIEVNQKYMFASGNRVDAVQNPDEFDDSEYNNYCNGLISSEDRSNDFSMYLDNNNRENVLAKNIVRNR